MEQHHFDATQGWGAYDTGQSAISCAHANVYPIRTTCHNAPWWIGTNAGHGHETEVVTYDTDGKHMLSATTTTLAAVCPPSGVAGTTGTPTGRALCPRRASQRRLWSVTGMNAQGQGVQPRAGRARRRSGAATAYSTDQMVALRQTLPARDHWKRESTQVRRISTSPAPPTAAASDRST